MKRKQNQVAEPIPYDFSIRLNHESASVLLRCLGYGKVAVSHLEHQNGVSEVIKTNIELIRTQVCEGMSELMIKQVASKEIP